ncbi:4889_t:CDS:2 [Funneliformis geosporum]|nr:4889_t:CDS:2 [Funneliformis geosporum]
MTNASGKLPFFQVISENLCIIADRWTDRLQSNSAYGNNYYIDGGKGYNNKQGSENYFI